MSVKTKYRHNKKRNTAFLFEVLIKEMAKCVMNKDIARQTAVAQVVKRHFGKGTLLYEDLHIYRAIDDTSGVTPDVARRIIGEAKSSADRMDRRGLFKEQSSVIKKINHSLGNEVYSNFVPNYKNLANISQLLGDSSVTIKKRVLIEESLVEAMSIPTTTRSTEEDMVPIDAIVYKTFVSKFNEEYAEKLQGEQRELLSRYIFSMSDNGVSLKTFMNEEVERLRNVIEDSYNLKEIKGDPLMTEKTKKVVGFLNSLHTTPLTETEIKKILKIQELAREVSEDG